MITTHPIDDPSTLARKLQAKAKPKPESNPAYLSPFKREPSEEEKALHRAMGRGR